MKPTSSRVLAVLLSALLVVGGANLAAYAANGSPLLLGKSNQATKTTTVKNKKGTALSLKAKSSKPPLKVSNSVRVDKLNADQLDGVDSTSLQNRPYVITLTGSSATNNLAFPISGVPAGDYLVTYNVTGTPSGGPTYFGCYLRRTSAPTVPFLAQLAPPPSGGWYVSASGAYTVVGGGADQLYCTAGGATAMVVPTPGTTAQLTLTRIDGSAALVSTGGAGRVAGGSAFGG